MEVTVIVTSERDIGEIVRRRRLALGLSQTQLAERAATTRQWVSRLEQGRGDVTVSRLLTILDVLGLNIEISRPSPGVAIQVPTPSIPSLIDESILRTLRNFSEQVSSHLAPTLAIATHSLQGDPEKDDGDEPSA